MRELHSLGELDELLNTIASENKVLIVDFFAVWCGPCVRVAPLYNELSLIYHRDDCVFTKVNVDECPEIASREGITVLPTFKVFKSGVYAGAVTGPSIDKLEKLINSVYFDDAVKELLSPPMSPLKNRARTKLFIIAGEALSQLSRGDKFEISLSDPMFENYFFPIPGCMQILFALGFEESDDSLVLSSNCSRGQVEKIARQLKPKKTSIIDPAKYKILSKLEVYRKQVAFYLDLEAQDAARNSVPLENLLKAAQTNDGAGSLVEVEPVSLLMQLLRWFKNDFFVWTRVRNCLVCGAEMTSRNGVATPQEHADGDAGRVEIYSCAKEPRNHPEQRFPRYNNAKKLLETREGRCGEWANCFCLILSSLKRADGSPWFPGVRFVVDFTDHVFCEIWLVDEAGAGRWVHLDPCEGLVDAPLVYELGWKKKLSYVFAVTVPPAAESAASSSAVDVTDVVWKYSTAFKEVRGRRTEIAEGVLARYLAAAHESAISLAWGPNSGSPFNILTIVAELAQMTREPAAVDPAKHPEVLHGRKTGSERWRRQRGELGGTSKAEDTWDGHGSSIMPTENELTEACIYFRYNCALDVYARPLSEKAPVSPSTPPETRRANSSKGTSRVYAEGWQSLASRWRNIERKHEKDWKMVYLSRMEGCKAAEEEGTLEWLVDLSGTEYSVNEVTLFATMSCFDDSAKVLLEVENGGDDDDDLVRLQRSPGDAPLASCADFAGSKRLCLRARLSTDAGDSPLADDPSGWQKCQIFRQKDSDKESWPLEFKVTLKMDTA